MARKLILAGKNGMRPIHPGEILREDFMVPFKLSANRLAEVMHVTAARVNEIAKEKRGITADTALRLGKALDTSADFWLDLQKDFDLRTAESALSNDALEIMVIKDVAEASLEKTP